MFGLPTTKILGALLAIAVASTGWFAYQHQRTETQLAETVAELEATQVKLTTANELLEVRDKTIDRMFQNQAKHNETVAGLRAQLKQRNSEINQYKGRQDTVYAKPGLVERLEQKALDEFFNEVQNQ